MFNPWVIISLITSLIGVYFYGHHEGYQECAPENAIQVAKLNEDARRKEIELTEQVNVTSANLVKANNDAKRKIDRLNSDLASGSVRLSVPVKAHCPVSATSDTSAASGDSVQERSELDGTVAQSLVAITNDGDAGIRQLNACIDAYNQVRDKYNQAVGVK